MRQARGRTIRLLLGTFVMVSMVGAACAKNASPASGGAQPPTSGSGHPAGGYGGGYGGGGGSTTASPSANPGGGAVAATVLQSNFQFSPSTVTVHQGDTIAVKNAAPGTPHTFTIPNTSIDVENDNQGQSTDVLINLAPGTYQFICRFHSASGMKGTLIVE